jgi:uncharacterized protein
VASAGTVATSVISYVEARAALARMKAGGRIDARGLRTGRRYLDHLWLDVLSVPSDDQLLADAADLADEHSLRGYDAMQLAAAASLRHAGEVRFACWDEELNAAATGIGLVLA